MHRRSKKQCTRQSKPVRGVQASRQAASALASKPVRGVQASRQAASARRQPAHAGSERRVHRSLVPASGRVGAFAGSARRVFRSPVPASGRGWAPPQAAGAGCIEDLSPPPLVRPRCSAGHPVAAMASASCPQHERGPCITRVARRTQAWAGRWSCTTSDRATVALL